jgi:signal transduction histidine kinase
VAVWEENDLQTGQWQVNYSRAIRWVDGRLVRLRVASDITALKEAEENKLKLEAQLRQAQKMEALGTLAGGIAHDFNNILYAMIGYAELAMGELPEDRPVRKHLDQIRLAGLRARDLVRQILSFSRQTEQELKPVALGPLVKEVLKLLRSSLPTTIEIRSELEAGAEIVLADPTRIHQMLMNLCTNAAQSMGEEKGGLLEVNLERVEVGLDQAAEEAELQPGAWCRLAIRDSGQGMDQETLDRIFEPFFTTKEIGRGTGLGLAVVHGIVKSHGGVIKAESRPGQGSLFLVYLPLLENEPDLATASLRTASAVGG